MTSPFIVNHLWQSSCFALLAALLTFALRKNSPKVRYWVWLGASLKFLIPFALLVSLGSVIPHSSRRPVSVVAPAFPGTLVQIAEPLWSSRRPTAPVHALPDWVPVAIIVAWPLGLLALALVRCRSWLRIRAALRAGTPIELPIPVPALICPDAKELGIFGFLRPVLVVPAQLLEHLNPGQLSAILTHELCHVRRRDNFFAAVHMAVETIFWFHPLVWWIGSRMVEERELACDEEVLRMGCEPAEYVEGILKVCRFCLGSPLACSSGVTGADVKKRLRAILAGSIGHELNRVKKITLAMIGLSALALPVVVGVLNAPAQERAARVEFEVASVKPGDPLDPESSVRSTAAGIFMKNTTLKNLLQNAYHIRCDQIEGGPKWMDSERFTIDAKLPTGVSRNLLPQALQSLLEDRFKLQVHRESRIRPVFALVQAKGGSKLHIAAPDEPGRGGFSAGPRKLQGRGVSISTLVYALASAAGGPVLDRTELQGEYDFTLEFAPLQGTGDDEKLPEIFTAIQQQLGLKLEPAKAPIETLVIDRAEKPSEN